MFGTGTFLSSLFTENWSNDDGSALFADVRTSFNVVRGA